MDIKPGEFLSFIDRAFEGMLGCIDQLGDELVNSRPELPGANSPFAIVYHCVQLSHWWVGMMGVGREMERNRDGEFTATGTVEDLVAAVAAVRSQLAADVPALESQAPLYRPDLLPAGSKIRNWTRGEALIHTYEELTQHLGQLEITRDILLAG